jgi:hypothetical protein
MFSLSGWPIPEVPQNIPTVRSCPGEGYPPWLIYLYSLSSYALRGGACPGLGRLPTSLRPGVACVPTCFPPGSLSPGHDPESRQFTGSFPAELSQIIAANGPELYLDVQYTVYYNTKSLCSVYLFLINNEKKTYEYFNFCISS